ncbi:hypothetical protein ABPG72_020828 [Tetrahymena utriculariae]
MRQRKQRRNNYAVKEHINLHNNKIQQFVDQKIIYLVKEVDSYVNKQSLLSDESIKLIQFNPKIINTPENEDSQKINQIDLSQNEFIQEEEEKEVESKITIIQKQIELFENLKSYVQKKLYISREGPQNQPEISQTQIFDTRKKLLNDQFKNINDIFNLNYLPNLNQQNQFKQNYNIYGYYRGRRSSFSSSSSCYSSSSRSRSISREDNEEIQSKNQSQKYFKYEWFLINKDQVKDFEIFQQYSFSGNLRYQSYYFKKSIQMQFSPLITTIDSFYQYNDYIQTSLLNNKAPIYVIIDLQFDSPLSLLAIIKILLTLESFNILKINVSSQSKDQSYNKLVETILKIALCQRSLQQLSINVQNAQSFQDFSIALLNAMSESDLENSYVRVFGLDLNYYEDNQNVLNNKDLKELFNQISRFKMLYHISAKKLPINQQNVENFQKILNLVTSAKLQQIGTELYFNAPNLTFLELQYNFRSSEEVHIKYDNFKDTTKLQQLNVNYSTQIEITSRKEIKRVSMKRLAEQNNQEVEGNSQEQQDETKSRLFQLNDFVRLNQLQILQIQLAGKQSIIDSFIEFFRQSQYLRKVNIEFKEQGFFKFDYSLFFPIIDYYISLELFNLKTNYYGSKIHYQKVNNSKEQYSLKTNCIPCEFSLKNATQMTLQFDLDKKELMQQLDNIYQSLKNSTKVKQIKLQVNFNFQKNEYIKYEVTRSDLKLFSYLIDLKELEIFEVSQFFNQCLIISLSNFIEKSQSLKVLRISRDFYKQLYLDFTQLLKCISISQTIEQVSINLFIANSKVKKNYAKEWQETKIKNFYQPFCYMVEHSQNNLLFIQYEDQYDDQGIKLILEALLKLKHSKYFIFQSQVMNKIQNLMGHDKKLKDLFEQVYQKGCLVNPNYNFQMAHKF